MILKCSIIVRSKKLKDCAPLLAFAAKDHEGIRVIRQFTDAVPATHIKLCLGLHLRQPSMYIGIGMSLRNLMLYSEAQEQDRTLTQAHGPGGTPW